MVARDPDAWTEMTIPPVAPPQGALQPSKEPPQTSSCDQVDSIAFLARMKLVMATKTNESEHFVLTVVGGDMDGQVLDSRSPIERERTVVEMFLGASNRGQAGKGVKSLVSYASILEDRMTDAAHHAVKCGEAGQPVKVHAYRAISRTMKDGVWHVLVESKVLDILSGLQCPMFEQAE